MQRGSSVTLLLVALLGLVVLCLITPSYAQANSGLVIDTARLASTFIIRDEYYDSSDCRVTNGIVGAGFRYVARFDFALANLGTRNFLSGNVLKSFAPCSNVSAVANSLIISVRKGGAPTPVVVGGKGVCLSDMERSATAPSGTAAPTPTYRCLDSPQGISVGWQSVYDRETDTSSVDVTNLYTDTSGFFGPGQNYTMIFKFAASLYGNYSDVTYSHTFFLPYDLRCFPAPQYTSSVVSSVYVTPTGHTTISTPLASFGNQGLPSPIKIIQYTILNFAFTDKFFCNQSVGPGDILYIRDNGIVTFDPSIFFPSGLDGLNQNDNVINSKTYFLGNTIFPYWDSVYYVNDTRSPITASDTSGSLIITWQNMDRLLLGTHRYTFQMRLDSNRDIYLSYQAVFDSNTTFNAGGSATVGVCAGPLQNPSGPNSGPNTYAPAAQSNNCNLYSVNQGKLTAANSIKFTRSAATERTLPTAPVFIVQGPTSGQKTFPYVFTVNFTTPSPNAIVRWTWGDASIPTSGLTANHTWEDIAVYTVHVQVYDGVQFVTTNFTMDVGAILLSTGTRTNGDGGDGSAGYIALAVILPIVFVLMLLILVAIFLFIFYKRHILSSGGAWWEEDPIYLNLEE